MEVHSEVKLDTLEIEELTKRDSIPSKGTCVNNVDEEDDTAPQFETCIVNGSAVFVKEDNDSSAALSHAEEVVGNVKPSDEQNKERKESTSPLKSKIVANNAKEICELCKKKVKFTQLAFARSDENVGKRLHLCAQCKVQSKTYKCDECPKVFKRSYNALIHKQIHAKSRDGQRAEIKEVELVLYKCDNCPKSFKSQYTLDIHKMFHKGEKPFACEVCGEKFWKISGLACHKGEEHTAERESDDDDPFSDESS